MNYCVRERRIFLNGEIKIWPGWGKRKNKIESQVRRGPEQEVWFLRPSLAQRRGRTRPNIQKPKLGLTLCLLGIGMRNVILFYLPVNIV